MLENNLGGGDVEVEEGVLGFEGEGDWQGGEVGEVEGGEGGVKDGVVRPLAALAVDVAEFEGL